MAEGPSPRVSCLLVTGRQQRQETTDHITDYSPPPFIAIDCRPNPLIVIRHLAPMKRIAFIYSAVMAEPLDIDEWKVIDRVVARIGERE